MRDGLTAGDESDRLLIRWDLDSRQAEAAAAGAAPEPDLATAGGETILSAGPDQEPIAAGSSARVLLCQTPEDIVALRRSAPALARGWRIALRDALGGSLSAGYSITGATRSGWYVLERRAE